MTKKEYEEQLASLQKNYKKKESELALAFAKSNNLVRVGDKVRSNDIYILVEKMVLFRASYCSPCVKYIGTELKKDGTPKKRGTKGEVLQKSVIEINGEPYKYEV